MPALSSWALGSGDRALAIRYLVDTNGTLVQDPLSMWLLKANGKMSLSISANGPSYNENDYDPSVSLTGVSGTAM